MLQRIPDDFVTVTSPLKNFLAISKEEKRKKHTNNAFFDESFGIFIFVVLQKKFLQGLDMESRERKLRLVFVIKTLW